MALLIIKFFYVLASFNNIFVVMELAAMITLAMLT